MRLLLLLAVFVVFTGWSTSVAVAHGPLGFLTLSLEHPWALQMLLDLFIALFVAWAWLRHDAKQRGIPALPYQVATFFLGSPAVLAYLIHREIRAKRSTSSAPQRDANAPSAVDSALSPSTSR